MQIEQKNIEKSVIIKVSELHKEFDSREVLRGVNLDVYKGEVLSIMGPSGSGKSTLLYCMAGILPVNRGSIFFNNVDLAKYQLDTLIKLRRTSFGFIFQFGELVPELPVRDNIALPLLLKGVKKKQAYQTADKWATLVGIENVASSLPHTLSGGETQRVAIARAMAIDPEVIFADEPTGSLDSVNAKKIMELFVDLAHKYNKTIILVTHSRETAAYADRIILLGDGIIESGASHGIA
jgi:putative ABC transport system ATP-binding protein